MWWDGNAGTGNVKYLTKRSKIFVEGTPDVKLFKDKNGQSRAELKLLVRNVDLIAKQRFRTTGRTK